MFNYHYCNIQYTNTQVQNEITIPGYAVSGLKLHFQAFRKIEAVGGASDLGSGVWSLEYMHKYLHTGIDASMYASIHKCIDKYIDTCINIQYCNTCKHMYICICMHANVFLHMYANACMQMDVCRIYPCKCMYANLCVQMSNT